MNRNLTLGTVTLLTLGVAINRYHPVHRANAKLRRIYGGEIHSMGDNWSAIGLDFRNVTVIAHGKAGLVQDCKFSGRAKL